MKVQPITKTIICDNLITSGGKRIEREEDKITLLLPSCGLNYLWQLGGIKALCDLKLMRRIDIVYGCSGGAWASIFMGLGEDVVADWLSNAAEFYSEWQRKNRFRYLRRSTVALTDDSRKVLEGYGFFGVFKPCFNIFFKLFELHPDFGFSFLNVTEFLPKEVHKLAVASSTIPGVTGTVASVRKKKYIDGGVRHGFRKEEINPSARQNIILTLDPHSFRTEQLQYADISINPSRPLSSGLKLGLPSLIPQVKIQGIIDQGFADIMDKKEKIVNQGVIS